MKVRANTVYTFRRNGYDILMPEHCKDAQNGQKVRVINLRSAPKCNTMGMCHIEDAESKTFLGMCDTRSLSR